MWKCMLVVLVTVAIVEATLVSAVNVHVVTIRNYGVINYGPGDLKEDVPGARNDSSDIFDYALENLNESNHEDAMRARKNSW